MLSHQPFKGIVSGMENSILLFSCVTMLNASSLCLISFNYGVAHMHAYMHTELIQNNNNIRIFFSYFNVVYV